MKLNPLEIQRDLVEFVSQQLLDGPPGAGLGPEDDLLSGGLVDSLGVMRVVQFLEQRYGVKIPPADITIDHFVSVAAISAYLAKRREDH